MSIATFTELQTAIGDYLARADLTAKIPDFITLAEAHFNREIRTREMTGAVGLTLVNGVATLPTDFLEWVNVQWIGVRSRDLRYAEPDSEAWRFRYRPNGDPSMFGIFGSVVSIRPILAGNIVLTYYQQLSTITINNGNWLLTKYPDLYVYRTLAEAYLYQKDSKKAAEFIALADAETQKANGAADSNKEALRPNKKPPGDDTGTA